MEKNAEHFTQRTQKYTH